MTSENVVLILSAITGIIGMPIIQYFKNKLNIDANWALLLATGVSLVLGVLVAVLGGSLAVGEPVTLQSVVESATVVFSISSVFYKLLLGDKTSS